MYDPLGLLADSIGTLADPIGAIFWISIGIASNRLSRAVLLSFGAGIVMFLVFFWLRHSLGETTTFWLHDAITRPISFVIGASLVMGVKSLATTLKHIRSAR